MEPISGITILNTPPSGGWRGPLSILRILWPLPYAHTSLCHVNHIVTEFLALRDDVHVDSADGIGVFLFVDICDILTLELVTEVVDLRLNIEYLIDIKCLAIAGHEGIHLSKRLICKSHHLRDMAILFLCEVFLA